MALSSSAGDNISKRDLPGVTGTDLVNTNPLLGPLAANGGPTATTSRSRAARR